MISTFEAVKIAWAQDKNGYVLKLSIHPNDVPESVALDPLGTIYTVEMRPTEERQEQNKSLDARAVGAAGMLCRNKMFQEFLRTQQGFIHVIDEATARAALLSTLGLETRAEIKGSHALRMMEIASEFRKWYSGNKRSINKQPHTGGSGEGMEDDFGL